MSSALDIVALLIIESYDATRSTKQTVQNMNASNLAQTYPSAHVAIPVRSTCNR